MWLARHLTPYVPGFDCCISLAFGILTYPAGSVILLSQGAMTSVVLYGFGGESDFGMLTDRPERRNGLNSPFNDGLDSVSQNGIRAFNVQGF